MKREACAATSVAVLLSTVAMHWLDSLVLVAAIVVVWATTVLLLGVAWLALSTRGK